MADFLKNPMRAMVVSVLITTVYQTKGALMHIEEVNGELSDDYQNPTVFNLTEGSNQISGTLLGSGFDQDFFTLNVAAGLEITEFNIISYFSNTANNGSFVGVQPGSTLSHSPAEIQADDQIAINFLLFSSALVDDTDDPPILSRLTVGNPLGGVDTLTEGSYAFWLNETGDGSEWTLEFVVESVPEPSTISFLTLCSAVFLMCRKR